MLTISVIIPVYNVAPYLRACLDSVVAAVAELEKVGGENRWTNEECPSVEVICVDDGSTDGSGKILDEYAERVNSSSCEFERESAAVENKEKTSAVHLHLISSPVIRVLHQQNAGVSAARNAALNVSQGEWVAFLDADDVWSPNWLKACADIIRHNPDADMIGFGFCRGEKYFHFENLNCKLNQFSGPDVLGAYTPYFWSRLYRRDLLQGVCFRDYTIGEDILFQTEALVKARKVIVTSDMLYGYRERQGSAINSALSERKVMDRVGYLTTVIKLLLQSGKRISPSLMRICVNGVTEGFANEYFCLDRSARKRVRMTWLRNVHGLSGIGVFQSLRLTILRWLPFSFGMRVLCLWPYRLKSRGWRRGGVS